MSVKDALNGGSATKKEKATKKEAVEDKVKVEQETVEETVAEDTATEEKTQEVAGDAQDESVEIDNTPRLGPDGEVLTGVVPGSLTETLLGGESEGESNEEATGETEEPAKENTDVKSSDVDIKSIIASRVITHARPQTPLEELNSRKPGYKSVKEELVSRKRNLPGQRYQAGGRRGRKIQ